MKVSGSLQTGCTSAAYKEPPLHRRGLVVTTLPQSESTEQATVGGATSIVMLFCTVSRPSEAVITASCVPTSFSSVSQTLLRIENGPVRLKSTWSPSESKIV